MGLQSIHQLDVSLQQEDHIQQLPTVAITTTGTMIPPTVQAVGVGTTIHPITGIVFAISFDPIRPLETVGTGQQLVSDTPLHHLSISFSGSPSPVQALQPNVLISVWYSHSTLHW